MQRRASLGRCAWVLGLLAACSGQEEPPGSGAAATGTAADTAAGAVWFEECAVERGIVFDHVSGHAERYYFPEIMGGGAALFDADADGDLDAYLVQSGSVTAPRGAGPPGSGGPTNRFFTNDGAGRFEDATEASATADRGYGMGVAWGDVDNDGHPDLHVLNLRQNVLYVNDGRARFQDRSAVSGLDDGGWSVSGAFFDPDRDGDLDLFLVNYIYWTVADDLLCQGPPHGVTYCSPKSYDAPAPDELYANRGDGSFQNVSVEAGLRTAFGNGLGVVTSDFDGDGWEDVYVANDGTPNQLWRNAGGLTFVDAAVVMGCAVDQDGTAKAGMGVSVADTDDDGDEDLLVVNLDGESDSFYRNDGSFFSDRTPVAGLARTSRGYTRFGCGLVDFDNDGWLDFFTANGRVIHPPQNYTGDPFAEPNLLYRGEPGPRFREVAPRGGTRPELVATSRAAAFGDVDGDGGVDILILNRDGPAHLLRNVVAGTARWLRLRLVDTHGRDAFGARARFTLGERDILRTVRSAYSYGAANEAWIHVGLGAADGAVDGAVDGPVDGTGPIEVRWPTGETETFGQIRVPGAGEHVELHQGQGR